MDKFYTYLWLREDGTPYYIGKGSRDRAYTSWAHGVHRPVDRNRIIIHPAKTEAEAFEVEITLVWYYGRKDLGTGCLRNLTDGGENPPNATGLKRTEETKRRMSESMFKSKPWHHGSTGYQRHQCRCKVCIAWHRKHYKLKR